MTGLPELKRELLARSGRGAKYGLERLRSALAPLGHPERGLPVVHVAGTNGKGSVCAMVEAVAREAGLTTGTFTSPHLCQLAERIRIDGASLTDDAFADALGRVLHPSVPFVTFFEAITLTAMVAMQSAEVDLAIFEVGLGGRLDATNVLEGALATAIVSIGLDHTGILGHDLAGIAREKAGIFRPDTPAILGVMEAEAEAAAREVARAVKAEVWSCSQDLSFDEEGFVLPDGSRIDAPRVGLLGEHQRANASVVAGLAAAVDQRLRDRRLVSSLPEGLAAARWPGRLEVIEHEGRRIVLDCAHNPAGAATLRDALEGPLGVEPADSTLLFGAMGDKAWPEMLDTIADRFTTRVYARPIEGLAGRLPADPAVVAARHAGIASGTPETGLADALAHTPSGGTLVVAGSIFLVGAVRAELLTITRDVSVPL